MNNFKPRMLAIIREADCIGCTRCIQACPADAILGSAQWMHTVIAEECIGCQLCIPPCPVDCIEMVPILEPTENKSVRKQKAVHFRKRYHARQARLLHEAQSQPVTLHEKGDKKAYIQAAIERARLKKIR